MRRPSDRRERARAPSLVLSNAPSQTLQGRGRRTVVQEGHSDSFLRARDAPKMIAKLALGTVALLAACVADDVSLNDRPCPCLIPTYVCDTRAKRCVLASGGEV